MDLSLLYRRTRDIIRNPVAMWHDVKDENRSVNELRTSFLFPMALLIAIAGVIGTMLFTYNGFSLLFPLIVAVKYLIGFIATIEIGAIIVNEIAVAFIPQRSFGSNYKLVLYSFTPFMVAMVITRLFSSLVFINFAGLYGIYIAWLGVQILTDSAPSFRLRYTLLVSLATLVIYMAVFYILNAIHEGIYFAYT